MTRTIMGSTRQRLLKLGIKHFGSDGLAERLGAKAADVERWASGKSTIPNPKLLMLVDLLDELKVLGDEA